MTQLLFQAQMSALPAPVPRGFAVLMPVEELPVPVRHVDGYGEFVAYVEGVGSSPVRLRDDPRVLLEFVQSHPEVLAEESLLQSTGVFFGNSIAQRYPAAQWQVLAEPEIGVDGGGGFPMVRGLRDLAVHPEWNDQFLAALDRELGRVS